MKLIPLTKGQYAIIDDNYFEHLSKWRWRYKGDPSRGFYALRNIMIGGRKGKWTTIYMHQEVLGKKEGFITDHINGDGLDNRLENLRFCTHSQNRNNQRKNINRKGVTSKFKGVSMDKICKKWRSSIWIEKKNKSLGYFKTELDAALAYNKAAIEFFGEFARINEIL